jgi:hypothetical protein
MGADEVSSAPARDVTREELLGAGQSREEADQTLVRLNAQRVLHEIAGPWVVAWALVMTLLFAAVFITMLVLLYQWIRFMVEGQKCDAPLNLWLGGALGMYCVNQGIFNRPWFRRWAFSDPRINLQAEHLSGVIEFSRAQKFFVGFQVLLDLTWKVTGLYWAYTAPTCARTAPGLWTAFVTLIWLTLFGALCTWTGLFSVLRALDTLRVLQPNRGSPPGTLEKAKVVPFATGGFDGSIRPTTCPICIDSFDDKSDIRETPCGHCFHSTCLEDWLRRARTCPLCREDLAQAGTV